MSNTLLPMALLTAMSPKPAEEDRGKASRPISCQNASLLPSRSANHRSPCQKDSTTTTTTTMATLIRIKRHLSDEPLETILVRPKRMRMDSGATGGKTEEGVGGGRADLTVAPPTPPPTLLERVGTVESKDAKIDARLLKEYKKGWELRQTYKRLGETDSSWREAGRKMAKEREKENRETIISKLRGPVTETNAHTDKQAVKTRTGKTEDEEEEEEEEEGKSSKKRKIINTEGKEEEEEEEEAVQFYDAQISFSSLLRKGSEDVITCNGEPMKSEKYVYDIYYCPQNTDWSELVFEEPKLTTEVKEDNEEDEDDENDEDNWRNDYPDEDEDEDEYGEEYDYFDRPSKNKYSLDCDTDESFDAKDYEETDDDDCGFDEDGNLITLTSLSNRLKMTMLRSDDDSD